MGTDSFRGSHCSLRSRRLWCHVAKGLERQAGVGVGGGALIFILQTEGALEASEP